MGQPITETIDSKTDIGNELANKTTRGRKEVSIRKMEISTQP